MKRWMLLALCLAWDAQAQPAETHWCGQPQVHPLDAGFARTIERSGGVTAGMRDAQDRAYAGWDAELNRQYRLLLKDTGNGTRAAALRKAQRAWLAWDGAEADSDAAFVADQGSAAALAVADQAIARRRQRACDLYRLRDGAMEVE